METALMMRVTVKTARPPSILPLKEGCKPRPARYMFMAAPAEVGNRNDRSAR
jgi:hypothetical protein